MDDPATSRPAIADPLEAMLGFQLRRAAGAVMAVLAAKLEPIGLKPSEASLLMMIGAQPGCTQSEIGRALRAHPANLVPLINRLAQSGALERAPGRGRAIALSLSDDGRRLCDQVTEIFRLHEARIARALPAGRGDEIAELLRRITEEVCAADHEPGGA